MSGMMWSGVGAILISIVYKLHFNFNSTVSSVSFPTFNNNYTDNDNRKDNWKLQLKLQGKMLI